MREVPNKRKKKGILVTQLLEFFVDIHKIRSYLISFVV